MKSLILGSVILVMGFALAVSGATGKRAVMVSSSNDSLSDDCSDHLQHEYGRHYQSVVRGEEARSLPNQRLDIQAEQNGGIHISTWDKPDFSLKLCKVVASDSDERSRRILAETKLVVEGGRVTVSSGGRDDDYNLSTLLLVKAPRNAQVSMEVENGGIAIRHFSGTAEARAMNGGIALGDSNGKLTVRAQNGGVSIKDCGGEVKAEVENGGLSIILPERWDGKGLEAHAENGGLMIGVPRNFSSSLEVTASNYVSIVCKGEACDKGQRTWDNNHRILRLGNGEPQIRASTVNGGIVIENRDRGSI